MDHLSHTTIAQDPALGAFLVKVASDFTMDERRRGELARAVVDIAASNPDLLDDQRIDKALRALMAKLARSEDFQDPRAFRDSVHL